MYASNAQGRDDYESIDVSVKRWTAIGMPTLSLNITNFCARSCYLCVLPYAVVILGGDASLFSDVRQWTFVTKLTGARPLKEQANPLLTVHVYPRLSSVAETYQGHSGATPQRLQWPAPDSMNHADDCYQSRPCSTRKRRAYQHSVKLFTVMTQKKRNNLPHVQYKHVKSQLSFWDSPAVFCDGSYYRFKSLLPPT